MEARLLYLGNELFFARLSVQRDAAKNHVNDGACQHLTVNYLFHHTFKVIQSVYSKGNALAVEKLISFKNYTLKEYSSIQKLLGLFVSKTIV